MARMGFYSRSCLILGLAILGLALAASHTQG